MAEKAKPKAEERLFTIPLRKEWLKVPRNKRAKRSMNTMRSFLSRHMKIPETGVRLSAGINQAVWVRGAARPPSKVRIKASLDAGAGIVFAGLPDEKPPQKEDTKKVTSKNAKGEEKPPAAQAAGGIKERVEKIAEQATSATQDAGKEEVKEAVEEVVRDTQKDKEVQRHPEDQKVTSEKAGAYPEKARPSKDKPSPSKDKPSPSKDKPPEEKAKESGSKEKK